MDLYATQSQEAPELVGAAQDGRPNPQPRPDPRPGTRLTATIESMDEEGAGSLLSVFAP